MFVHIGGDTVVRSRDVIFILDHQTVKASKSIQAFLEEKPKQLVEKEQTETKSYVITAHTIYCSPVSSMTLARRAQIAQVLDSSVQTDFEELT